MSKTGRSILKRLRKARNHPVRQKIKAREQKFCDVVRGSVNVYRVFTLPDADVRQFKVILSSKIIKTLDNKGLSVRKAQRITGAPAPTVSRLPSLRTAKIDRLPYGI